MITPQFEVDQDNDFVYVNIRAPYIKASMIQFEVADNVFVFSLPPYYLRLRLPGNMIEDDRMTSNYDLKTSTIKCKVAKLVPGEHFDDLDMMSKLLATKQQLKKVGIQEVNSEPNFEDEDFDWEIEQKVPEALSTTVKYGFNNNYSEMVNLSMVNGSNDINELAEPEKETSEQRLELLRSTTIDSFDLDHYWADKYDDEMIKELIYYKLYKTDEDRLDFSSQLKDRVMRLGQREFILNNRKQVYLGLVPLVFGWAYDNRANLGDFTVESSWTVGKLAPSLCFLYNDYMSMEPLVIDCTARALTKPLYRNWDLIAQTWRDTIMVFRRGKKELLTVFAKLLEIFESDLHQVYRSILLEDYTVWVQYASDPVINSLTNELEKSVNELTIEKLYLPIKEPEFDSDDE